MLKSLKISLLVVFTATLSFLVPINAKANEPQGTELVTYAIQFIEDPNIIYIYGGKGRGHSLEDCHAQNLPTDCSGFVSSVYMHFGISVPTTSSLIGSKGYPEVSLENALPGDICWWKGHVGLFAGWTSSGQAVLIHTNKTDPGPSGKENLIHAAIMGDMEELGYQTYRKPERIFRVLSGNQQNLTFDGSLTDGTVQYGNGNTIQSATYTQVLDSLDFSVGSLVTESDLTGMVLEWSAIDAQKAINLPTFTDLSLKEQIAVGTIGMNMKITDSSNSSIWASRLVSLTGILLMLYNFALILALIYDKVNTFIDLSLVKLLTFGKWVLVESPDDLPIGHEDMPKGTKFLTAKAIVTRCVLIMVISIFIINGRVYSLVLQAINFVVRRM